MDIKNYLYNLSIELGYTPEQAAQMVQKSYEPIEQKRAIESGQGLAGYAQNKSFAGSFISDITSGIKKAGQSLATGYQEARDVQQQYYQGERNLLGGIAGQTKAVSKGLSNSLWDIISGTAKAVTPDSLEAPIGQALGVAAQKVGGVAKSSFELGKQLTGTSELVDGLVKSWEDFQVTNPKAAQTVEDSFLSLLYTADIIATVTPASVGSKGAVKAGEKALATTGDIARGAGEILSDIPQTAMRAKGAIREQAESLASRIFKDPKTTEAQREKLLGNYMKLIEEGNISIEKALGKVEVGNRPAKDLVKDFVEEGGLLEMKGDKLSAEKFKLNQKAKIAELAESVTQNIPEGTFSLRDFKQELIKRIDEAQGGVSNYKKVIKQADTWVENFTQKQRSLGVDVSKGISNKELDMIRKEANQYYSKNKAISKPFENDFQKILARTAKEELIKINPAVEGVLNAESKAYRAMDVADVFAGKKVPTNYWIEKLGSAAALYGAGVVGLGTIIAGGPLALFIGAIVSGIGARPLANYIRNRTFSPKVFNMIKDAAKADPSIIENVMKEASKADADILKRLLPAPTSEVRTQISRQGTINLPEDTKLLTQEPQAQNILR